MLVLNRKVNESIQIGADIEIKVLAMEGDQIKIGISAPETVRIYRGEIYLDVQKQNNEAANVNKDILALLQQNKD
ncbi:carbon storage regulator CsrA [Virgibacillus sp. 179-BFC.A HS]|uniref:Translational regulator CsrA n=1 Tax=Tigheibacillus jepli TaxID=3035914 RepID=A0ABU5CFI5_9BACI|nr:carbon storage regulator CsrA [Virgibacillus sp. 179-BFC.A HS]MDY0405092.1 carbon storage regulator CsrA [Virgibacillus sp. 179-BFC.A HS]